MHPLLRLTMSPASYIGIYTLRISGATPAGSCSFLVLTYLAAAELASPIGLTFPPGPAVISYQFALTLVDEVLPLEVVVDVIHKANHVGHAGRRILISFCSFEVAEQLSLLSASLRSNCSIFRRPISHVRWEMPLNQRSSAPCDTFHLAVVPKFSNPVI